MSQELPKIEKAPQPVKQADVKLDSVSAARAEIDEVFQNENIINLETAREAKPEKTIAPESQTVLAMTNKVMELRQRQMQEQFFIKRAA